MYNSITFEKLRNKYEDNFHTIMSPWRLDAYEEKIIGGDSNYPRVIGSWFNQNGTSYSSLYNFDYLTGSQLLDVSSTSASEGAKEVILYGIGENFEPEEEVVTLNGTNAVSTVLKFKDVNKIEVNKFKVNNSRTVGTITVGADYIVAGLYTNPFVTINAGGFSSTQAKYTTHWQEELYITKIRIEGPTTRIKTKWSMHTTKEVETDLNKVGDTISYYSSPDLHGYLDHNGKQEIVFDEPYHIPSRTCVYFVLDSIDKFIQERSLTLSVEGYSFDYRFLPAQTKGAKKRNKVPTRKTVGPKYSLKKFR